jgi:hypothetical protein
MSNHTKQIKDILINLAIEDKLPMDLNELDPSIFEPVFQGSIFLEDLKDRYVSLKVPAGVTKVQMKLDDEGVVLDAFIDGCEEAYASTWKTYQMMEDGEE